MIDTVVSGNRARNMAGISNRGTLHVLRSQIVDNVAEESGGGIYNIGFATVTETTIARNVAPSGGAGFFNLVGSVTVRDSTISDNRGAAVHTSGWTDVDNTTISNNHGHLAGAFYVYNGTLRITDSTISGNNSDTQGGAINIDTFWPVPESVVDLRATTITDNEAPSGGGIEIVVESQTSARVWMNSMLIAGNRTTGKGPDVLGEVISFGYNFIGNGQDSGGWAATDNVGTSAVPLDPKLAPLSDYGGKTLTHAIKPGSPAIKTGDPALGGSFDQRGTWRTPYYNPDPGAFQTSQGLTLKWVVREQVLAGQPFRATLVVLDGNGNTGVFVDMTIRFQSSDPLAKLPPDYTFVPEGHLVLTPSRSL